MAPRKGYGYDWVALKREWLAGNETLEAFRVRHNIVNERNFHLQVRKGGWKAARQEIARATDAKVAAEIVKKGVEEWEDEVALLKGIRAQVAYLLRGHLDKEGNVIAPMPPKLLKDLAETVAKSVIAKKHIKGEPVGPEGGDGETSQHLHLHAHIVRVVNEIQADGGPTPPPPPRLRHQRGG
jgi:hypothetical protein